MNMIIDLRSVIIILFLSLLLCIPISTFAQNIKVVDSLIQIFNESKFAKKEEASLARKIAIFHPNATIGLSYARQSLKVSKEIKNPLLEARALEEISLLENRLGNNNKSLEASLNALHIYETLQLVEQQAASFAQLANNYISNKNYELAIKYLKNAETIYSNSKHNENYALTILNLGEAYRLGKHLDSASAAFLKTLRLNNRLNNNTIQGYSRGNLGMVYNSQNKLTLAKENLGDAIDILTTLDDHYSISVYIAELGKVYKKENKYKMAEDKFIKALTMAKQAGLKEQIRDFCTLLSNFYEHQHKYAQALKYQKVFQVYQDSLVNKETVQKIERLKANYEIDKRESEIFLLNTINQNQKYWIICLAIGISLLLFLAYLLYKGNKRIKLSNLTLSKQKGIIAKREEEKATLLKELNHRIKNNLQMISSLLSLQSHELKEHPAQEAILAGKNRVEALSLVHRKLYQENLDTRIHLKDYIEELVLGLFYGYGAKFKPNLNVDDISVSLDVAIPLALIINEIIINSLKYAYKNIDKPILKIVMSLNKCDLNIEASDNGIGFNINDVEKKNSFGIKLIYSLIEQLEGAIHKLEQKGTHWKIRIKLT